MGLSKKKKLEMCAGCRDNYYNGQGADECWMLKTARKVERKEVGFWDTPPWTHQPVVETLSCYNKEGYVYVEPHRTN